MKFFHRLIGLLFGLNTQVQANEESWRQDPIESTVGIHVLYDYGNKHEHLSGHIDMELITKELQKLDWSNRFYQFIVVSKAGFSMEVGGSLNGIDGLSAMFTDRENRIQAVIIHPPETVQEMKEIIQYFITDEESWMQKYDFDFRTY